MLGMTILLMGFNSKLGGKCNSFRELLRNSPLGGVFSIPQYGNKNGFEGGILYEIIFKIDSFGTFRAYPGKIYSITTTTPPSELQSVVTPKAV